MFKKIVTTFSLLLFSILPKFVYAHEAYVMDRNFFWDGIHGSYSLSAFSALSNLENLKLVGLITASILLFIILNFLFRLTTIGNKLHFSIEKFAFLGPLFVRITVAISFFYSAYSWSFLGPELPIEQMPFATLIRILLFAVSIMIALGLFTRIAASIAFVLVSIGFGVFGLYLVTYFNYVGEIIVLMLFGMRVWSLDYLLFGPLKHFKKFEKYETTIVRVFYGIALMYAGLTVKILHPDLTLSVVNEWNLTQFHWLFPSDPMLVVLGAGISEIFIGFLILIGFEMRMTILISLFYITLSLGFFRELVWPHLMLYGISFNLLVQPEVLTFDHFIFERHRKYKKWWKRLIEPHNKKGKSHIE